MARMGVSLKESKQKFSFMSNDLKDRLRDKIDEFADDYGLADIVYGSFVPICWLWKQIFRGGLRLRHNGRPRSRQWASWARRYIDELR